MTTLDNKRGSEDEESAMYRLRREAEKRQTRFYKCNLRSLPYNLHISVTCRLTGRREFGRNRYHAAEKEKEVS